MKSEDDRCGRHRHEDEGIAGGTARMHALRLRAGTAEKALAYLLSSPPRWLLWGQLSPLQLFATERLLWGRDLTLPIRVADMATTVRHLPDLNHPVFLSFCLGDGTLCNGMARNENHHD